MPVYSFNGGEGVGKTTVINEIKAILEKNGVDVVVYQAFGTPIGGHVRKMIKTGSFKSNLQKATLKFAALVDTWSEIQADLKEHPKRVILLDRDFLSFAAYDMFIEQNFAAVDLIEEMQSHLGEQKMIPDISFTLVCPDDIVAERLAVRKVRAASKETAEQYFNLDKDSLEVPEVDVMDENFRNINPYVVQGIMFKHEFLTKKHYVLDSSGPSSDVALDIISLMGVDYAAVH